MSIKSAIEENGRAFFLPDSYTLLNRWIDSVGERLTSRKSWNTSGNITFGSKSLTSRLPWWNFLRSRIGFLRGETTLWLKYLRALLNRSVSQQSGDTLRGSPLPKRQEAFGASNDRLSARPEKSVLFLKKHTAIPQFPGKDVPCGAKFFAETLCFWTEAGGRVVKSCSPFSAAKGRRQKSRRSRV